MGEGAAEDAARGPDVYLAVPDAGLRVTLLPLLEALRAAGLRVESNLGGRSMKSMMRHAASLGARRVVIVGPREHEEGIATVRDMESGEQRPVPLGDLVAGLAAEAGA
ncbi:MAG TPA: His/Gly/Thr/Pro-type tRNA ligase C-terminal domain-containing protein [Miltoncostaeaceae bacterium]|nr:His/Gly/Thr/Pro-type tRNA ligase C-terminal domain-containing protein [Miltoncostaeaceae bacterium]